MHKLHLAKLVKLHLQVSLLYQGAQLLLLLVLLLLSCSGAGCMRW
jgi:hypothetical protein